MICNPANLGTATGLALCLLTSCLNQGCMAPEGKLDERIGALQAKVAAAREAGVKADAVLNVGPGHAGFPNVAWSSGVSGTVHISADPGDVNEKDLLEHTEIMTDKLLNALGQGADPGTFSGRSDALERALEAARAAAAARAEANDAPPSDNSEPVSDTDSGT